VSDTSTNILAIKIGGDRGQIEQHLIHSMEGEVVPFSDENLAELRNDDLIRKIYKVDATGHDAEVYIIGSMTLKGS
jgi:hypothetical protein